MRYTEVGRKKKYIAFKPNTNEQMLKFGGPSLEIEKNDYREKKNLFIVPIFLPLFTPSGFTSRGNGALVIT